MKTRILITGGAGFIGTRLAAALAAGADLAVLDNLHAQVHGPNAKPPVFPAGTRFVQGDVCERNDVEKIVAAFDPEIVIHLAAETGTGQSADEPSRYCDVNIAGTALLIEALRGHAKSVRRVVLASSRAVYGEGPYRRANGQIVVPPPRQSDDLAAGRFDPLDEAGSPMVGVPVSAAISPMPGSVYGSTKLMQEYLLQQVPAPWEVAILRFQNVYGPGQSLRNPYTGVLSIFCQQAMAGATLNIYEDGEITRDFVYVDDIVRSLVLACTAPKAVGQVIDIGSGTAVTIKSVASQILSFLGMPADRLRVSGNFRPGDIRHAVADISRAQSLLGWQPQMSLSDGLKTLVEWARSTAS